MFLYIYIGAVAITGSYFTSEHNRIYYYHMQCKGDEQLLSDCFHYTYTGSLDYWDDLNRSGVACETNSSAGNCKIVVGHISRIQNQIVHF